MTPKTPKCGSIGVIIAAAILPRLVRLELGSLIGIWAPGAAIEFPLAKALQGTGVIGMEGYHPTLSNPFDSLFPTPNSDMPEKGQSIKEPSRLHKEYKIFSDWILVSSYQICIAFDNQGLAREAHHVKRPSRQN